MKTSLYALLYCLATACGAFAQCTIYVAPNGSDSNSGAVAAPFATPQHAVQAAPSGAVICLRGGSYAITSYFGVAKPVTLMSAPGEWAVLSADNSSASTVNTVIDVGAGNVTVQNLELIGGAYYGIKVSPDLLGVPPANVRILNSKIHDTGRDAIKAYQADGLVIQGNEVYNTGIRDNTNAEGIDVMASIPATSDTAAWGVIVRGNYIHNTATYGLYLKAGTTRGLVDSNRIDHTGGAGLALGQDSGQEYMRNGAVYECIDCTAMNNAVSNTQYAGLFCMAGFNIRFENNTAVNVATVGQAGLFSGPNHNNLGCGNAVYRNNAVSVSSSRPMIDMVQPSGSITFDFNVYYNSTGGAAFWWEGGPGYYYYSSLAQWQSGLAQDIHSSVAPLQVDSAYKPVAGSPLVDRGVTISDIGVDLAGTVRPQGPAYDIGAYELTVAVVQPPPPPPPPAAAATATVMQNGSLKAARRPQRYTLRAQVTSLAGVVNSGVVLFKVNGASAGTATVYNGAASLVTTIQNPVAGARFSLQASFRGTTSFAPSTSNVATLTIVR